MKKIKAANKQGKFLDSQANIIKLAIAAAVVLVLVVILMFIEGMGGKITFRNNSELKLEYVEAYFVDYEKIISEEIRTEVLESRSKLSYPIDPVNMEDSEANLEVRFKFENQDEMFVDAGYFAGMFDGNISITFTQKD